MAGTGHAYEIANPGAVTAFLTTFAERLPEGPGREWFLSRKLVRHLTSLAHTYPVTDLAALDAADGTDPAERPYLEAALAEGREVRAFAATLADAGDVHFDHLCDWVGWLHANDPATFAKLARIRPEHAAARAENWLAMLHARAESATNGTTSCVLVTAAGRRWTELLDFEAMVWEGRIMGHCVGNETMDRRRETGQARYLSLRDSGGRPLATAEFMTGATGPVMTQAYGRFNGPVPDRAWPCVAEILRHLEVSGSEAVAESAGACLDPSGRWVPLTSAWESVRWNGLAGVRRGTGLILFSPERPGVILLRARDVSETVSRCTVEIPGDRHYRIGELRELGRALDLLPGAFTSRGGMAHRELAFRPGQPTVPLRDLMERRDAGGIEVLVEDTPAGEILHVTKPGDAAADLLLLVSEKIAYPSTAVFGSASTGRFYARARNASRWTEADLSRCLEAMSGVEVTGLDREDSGYREFVRAVGPKKTGSGEWRSFVRDASEEPCVTAYAGRWKVTSYHVVLEDAQGRSAVSADFHAGTVIWCNGTSAYDPATAAETAAFFNLRGYEPSRSLFSESFLGGHVFGGFSGLFWLNGSWVTFPGPEEFLASASRPLGGRRKLSYDAPTATAVIACAPQDMKGAAEPVRRAVAEALCTWLATLEAFDPVFRHQNAAFSFLPSERKWQDSWNGRLGVLHVLRDLIPPRDSKRVEKAAARMFRLAVGKVRKRDFNSLHYPVCLEIAAQWPQALPEPALLSLLKKTRSYSLDLPREWDGVPPAGFIPKLRERIDGFSDGRRHQASWHLAQFAEAFLWRMNLPSQRPASLAVLTAWTECLEEVARFGGYRFERAMEDYGKAFEEAVAADPAAGTLSSRRETLDESLRGYLDRRNNAWKGAA